MSEPVRILIDPGIVQRVAQGFRYALTGVAPNGWFGPSQPMQPAAQEQAVGRQFDYQTGYNIQMAPRANEPVTFATLRGLADGYDLLRLVIETRKDQLERMAWDIQFRDGATGSEAKLKEVTDRLLRPDGRLSWRQWSRMLLEDMLVLDAPAVYLRRTNGGALFALEPIDGATIAPKIDDSGRAPMDGVAYQQIIKGIPACDYTADELVYYPRNLRTNRVYGFGPVEQIITTVNLALRRQVSQLQYYTEGNLPETLISVPKEWSVDQIKQFDEHFNSMLQGNTAARRRGFFVPEGTKPWDIKESPLKDQFDDWLARIVCFAFSVSPQALVQMQNRATAQVGAEEASKEGLEPLKLWMSDFINECIQRGFGYDDIEFVWSEEEAVSPDIRATVNDKYLRSGVKTLNEVRGDLGLDPVEGGDVHLIYTAAGAVKLDEVLNPPEPPPAQSQDPAGPPAQEVGKSADAPFVKFADDKVIDAVDTAGAVTPTPESAVDEKKDDHRKELAAVILALLTNWRRSVLIGIFWTGEDAGDPQLAEWAMAYADHTLGLVNNTTRRAIIDAMAVVQGGGGVAATVSGTTGPAANDSAAATIDAIKRAFKQAIDSRSVIAGDTVAVATAGFAARSAYKTAGVKAAEWITCLDSRVRDTHWAMHGQVRELGAAVR